MAFVLHSAIFPPTLHSCFKCGWEALKIWGKAIPEQLQDGGGNATVNPFLSSKLRLNEEPQATGRVFCLSVMQDRSHQWHISCSRKCAQPDLSISFTLISFAYKEQQMPLLIPRSPCALRLGTAWKVLLKLGLYNVLVSTLLKSPNKPGCELRQRVKLFFLPEAEEAWLHLDATRSRLLLMQEENQAATWRAVIDGRRDATLSGRQGQKWPWTAHLFQRHFSPQPQLTLPYGTWFSLKSGWFTMLC